jgi:predicted PurR-regulated permease PerM
MSVREAKASKILPREWVRFRTIRAFFVLSATLIGLFVCYLLALPFLAPLTWALTIAVLAAPLHAGLERRLRRPNVSAAVTVSWLALVIVIPLSFTAQQLWTELGTGAAALQKFFTDGDWQRTIDSYEILRWMADLIAQRFDVGAVFGSAATWFTNVGKIIVQGSVSYVVTVLVTFYLLFYFLRDRHEALRQLKMLSPLTESETDRVFVRVSDTIHAIIFGTVVTAVMQGTLGGAMFWLLGLPNPVFWGLVMAMVAIVPVLGTFVIWIPAAIYLALSGDWGKAVVLAAWGGIVIAGLDNLLYPILAGGRLRMHTVPMFISIVGGIIVFGTAGVILGPLSVAVTMTLLEIWRARHDAHTTA